MAAKTKFLFAGTKKTRTYKEAAKTARFPKSTLWVYATNNIDFRCLGHKILPMPFVANKHIFKNEFH